jgi:anti-sigma factor RsiW
MNCDQEMLQAFLDQELEEKEAGLLAEHLQNCRACRQELSRLKLLWLELEHVREINPSPALPYLRQQVVSQACASPEQPGNAGFDFWKTQRLAWRSMGLAVSYLPGMEQAQELAKTTGQNLQGMVVNYLAKVGRSWTLGLLPPKGRAK